MSRVDRFRRRAHTLLRAAPFFLLIALAASLSYRYHGLLRDQRDRVDHTYEAIGQLQTVLVRMIDAETGQRGYVLTGDERYLAPYREAVVAIPSSLATLQERIADNPVQAQHVDDLRALLQTKLDELRSCVQVRQLAGLEAARAIVLNDRGRRTMDALRATIATMQRNELALLGERTQGAKAIERRLLLTTLACAALSLVARIGLAWTARTDRTPGRIRT